MGRHGIATDQAGEPRESLRKELVMSRLRNGSPSIRVRAVAIARMRSLGTGAAHVYIGIATPFHLTGELP